jgi:transporter family-2 protein
VAINSFVMPRVGATQATVLVIAGQVVLGAMIDVANGKISNVTMTMIGISLVILGMWLGHYRKANVSEVHKPQKDRVEACA